MQKCLVHSIWSIKAAFFLNCIIIPRLNLLEHKVIFCLIMTKVIFCLIMFFASFFDDFIYLLIYLCIHSFVCLFIYLIVPAQLSAFPPPSHPRHRIFKSTLLPSQLYFSLTVFLSYKITVPIHTICILTCFELQGKSWAWPFRAWILRIAAQ